MSEVRASDDDREQLVTELNEHLVAGRLSTEDLEERTASAYAATTLGELERLRADLPATPRSLALSHRARRAHLTRRALQETGGSLGLFVVCTAVWASSHHPGQFWPLWVLLVFALSLVRNVWALYGPAPDLDAVEHSLESRRQRRLQQRSARRHRRG